MNSPLVTPTGAFVSVGPTWFVPVGRRMQLELHVVISRRRRAIRPVSRPW